MFCVSNFSPIWMKRQARWWILAALTLCINAHAEVNSNPGEKTLVIVGDSLTEGYGVSQAQAYPALLEKKLRERDGGGANRATPKWRVVNAGVSGSTSASALSRVQWQLKQKPNLLLLALGANDGLRGLPVKDMEKNLEAAILACKKASVRLVLVGVRVPPNYGVAYSNSFYEVFSRLAKRHSIPLIPFLLEGVGGVAELNLPDGIHPNEKGHVKIADLVYDHIKKLVL